MWENHLCEICEEPFTRRVGYIPRYDGREACLRCFKGINKHRQRGGLPPVPIPWDAYPPSTKRKKGGRHEATQTTQTVDDQRNFDGDAIGPTRMVEPTSGTTPRTDTGQRAYDVAPAGDSSTATMDPRRTSDADATQGLAGIRAMRPSFEDIGSDSFSTVLAASQGAVCPWCRGRCDSKRSLERHIEYFHQLHIWDFLPSAKGGRLI